MGSSFGKRMLQAAKLDARIFEEVEADTGAMGQAIAVVVLSSLAAGIGAINQAASGGIIGAIFAALIGWFIWALLTYLIGAKVIPEAQTSADLGQLLRTIGFSSSPGLLRVLGIIPGFTEIIFLISSIWMFAAMVVGVRQALDYTSTMRAFGVCFFGWLVQVILIIGLFLLIGNRG